VITLHFGLFNQPSDFSVGFSRSDCDSAIEPLFVPKENLLNPVVEGLVVLSADSISVDYLLRESSVLLEPEVTYLLLVYVHFHSSFSCSPRAS